MAAGYQQDINWRCRTNPALLVDAIFEALRSWGVADARAAAANQSLRAAVATDDWHSPCTAAVLRAFPGAVHVASDVWHPDSCREAAFVHDVMAASTWFIGHARSTFSLAIATIRAVQHGRPVTSTTYIA